MPDMNNKPKSDMKLSDIIGVEPSGIKKFDHTQSNIGEALGINSTRRDAINNFMVSIEHIHRTSERIEQILTTDKLHTTVERLMAAFMLGGYAEHMKSIYMISKLLGKMED